MMRKYLTYCLLVLLLIISTMGCQNKAPAKPLSYSDSGSNANNSSSGAKSGPLRFPGEFEPQQAVWLMWPSEIYNSNDRPVSPVMVKIINGLALHVPVKVMISSAAEASEVKKNLAASGGTKYNVSFPLVSHQSIWARDVGPIFVIGPGRQLRVVDFGFNNYSRGGNPDYVNNEAIVDKRTANSLGLKTISTPLICEGGAIESNGQGTLMTTESVVLRRNPNMTKAQIEAEFGRVMGIKKVIWLKKGLAEDDNITSGHINEIARFAGPNTVLVAYVLPGDRQASAAAQESYRRMEENYAILKAATDQDGKRLNVVRIPLPPTLYQEAKQTGKLPVRTYLNYALTNGAVLIQTYWHPGRSPELKSTEEQVIKQFGQIFPGRQVIGVDSENINLWGGGIHCVTQHMPALK